MARLSNANGYKSVGGAAAADEKVQIRVRLVREIDRALTPVWSNAGIGWDMFCFCATHADCKLLEHQIFHLVRLSGFSPKKVNAWLQENGCRIEFDQKDKKYAKARFSTQNQCNLWFEDIETKDGRMPRYQAACEFFDPGDISTVQVISLESPSATQEIVFVVVPYIRATIHGKGLHTAIFRSCSP